MRILILRHAEPYYPTDSLTEKGRTEAECLSRRMAKYEIRDFYTSPLGRARETAEYTLKRMGREAEVLPWLQEFRGRYPDQRTGKSRLAWDLPPRMWTAEPLMQDPEAWADAPVFRGGNVREIWDETKTGIDALMVRYGFRKDGPVWLCRENTHDTVALFCHFAIGMLITGYLLDMSPMILLHRCLCMPSALTELVTEERVKGEAAFRLTKLGDLTHLEAEGEPRSMAGLFPECYTGIDTTDQTVNNCTVLMP